MFLRNPKEVLSKNFNAPVSDFDAIPKDQLYIFNGTPAPANLSTQNVTGPGGFASGNRSFTYHFSKQAPYHVSGGSIKIIDPQTFPVAPMFSAALVTIKPGAMREIHWYIPLSQTVSLVSLKLHFVYPGIAPAMSGAFSYLVMHGSVCMLRQRQARRLISLLETSLTCPQHRLITSRIPATTMLFF